MPESISRDRYILGHGLGLLAASAISTFTSITSFLPVALDFVRLAFRVGSVIDQAVNRLGVDADGVWSKKFSKTAENEMQRLLQSQKNDSVRLEMLFEMMNS